MNQVQDDKDISPVPPTEGIKYTGSKLKLLPYILNTIQGLEVRSVLDAFSGTTRVSQALSQLGYDVTANDISEWSEVFGRCYLLSDKPDSFYRPYLDELNSLPGRDGWFTCHYGGVQPSDRKPFQAHNTRKLDAIRDRIDEYSLEPNDKAVLLTSLILAMDSVDNTLGHYASYLSGWSQRSYRTMHMQAPARFVHKGSNRVLKGDIFDALDGRYDLVYLDPPYGSNNGKMPSSRVRYASYYHIWKSIVLNDRPEVFGRADRRVDSRDTLAASVFEEYRKNEEGRFVAMDALERLIEACDSRYILLSYSSGGRASAEELSEIIARHARLMSVQSIGYSRNVMAEFCRTGEWLNERDPHKEYLFLMEKKRS